MSGKLFGNNCEKISAEIAPLVQQEILDQLKEAFPELICIKIGSVGKKPITDFNGDIDIAVKCKDIKTLEQIISTTFYYLEQVTVESYYIVSIKYPYQIIEDNHIEEKIRYVQCDFILMWDEDYTKFRYYCPNYINKESNYKVGAKIMFATMILNHTFQQTENIQYKYDFRPTALYKYIYNHKEKILTEEFVSIKPNEIANICFSDGDINHFNSVETLWEAIHSNIFKYPNEVKIIEYNWFINCWRKGWTSIVPENFELQYWTNDEIWKGIHKQDKINRINQVFQNGMEI